jgi:hypothetical protein
MRLIVALLGVLAALAVPATASAQPDRQGCQSVACEKRVAKKRAIHRTHPMCNTWACVQRVNRKRAWRARNYWKRQFYRLSAWDQAWARRISTCESGNRQVAREGGFLSYFQWVLSTWHMAGGSGNPENVGWYEQAVRAVRWRNRTSTMQWPACSRILGYA